MARSPAHPARRHGQVADLLAGWLAGLTTLTRTAYAADLASYARWSGTTPLLAASLLLRRGRGPANASIAAWVTAMGRAGAAPASVERRVAGIRSLLRAMRLHGLMDWNLDVRTPHVTPHRDTRGPGRAAFDRALAELPLQLLSTRVGGPAARWRAARDLALLRLLHDLALRESEALGLRLEDLELARGAVWVLRKRAVVRQLLTLPEETREALGGWLALRGRRPGPLFPGAPAEHRGPLTARAVQQMTRRLGLGNPHGLRHLAITEALERTGGDVRKVQRFSGHVDINNVLRYDDARIDLAGSVARLVAAAASPPACPPTPSPESDDGRPTPPGISSAHSSRP
jgi:integrase/recombinase XerC